MERRNRIKNKRDFRFSRNLLKPKADRTFFVLTLVLTVLGLITIADVSAPLALTTFGDSFFFVKQQFIWSILGLVVMLVASNIHYSFWKKVAPVFFGISILLLLLVLLPGFGSKLLGARRWIIIGPVNFQPSEIVKLSLAMFFAYLYDRGTKYHYYILVLLLLVGLVMLQPDLGTTIVILTVGVTQMFILGLPLIWLLGMAVGGSILGALLILISDYRRKRFVTFLQSLYDPLGQTSAEAANAAYHIRQILIAIGSGGLFGVGIGQSRQKYLFLPETATDSVFAIIAEEIGFVGSIVLILFLFYFALRIIKIARSAPDSFSKLLAVGLAAWIGGQMFFNIASMIALVPLTGIPLPFLSYGGSSLTMILFAMGILLNISKYGKEQKS